VIHKIGFSGDGATAGLIVAALFWPEHRRRPIRSNLIHSFRIQRLRLANTGLAGGFAKESLHFSIIEPIVHNVKSKAILSF
jgi:hypothetical protein